MTVFEMGRVQMRLSPEQESRFRSGDLGPEDTDVPCLFVDTAKMSSRALTFGDAVSEGLASLDCKLVRLCG